MHVRRALALATVVPVFLAGCSEGDPSEDPTPIMPDPTTSSASPTETATPEQESPEDFIRRWVDVHNEMWRTGDTKEFLALGERCRDCRRIADAADRIYGAGGTVKWNGWKVVRIEKPLDGAGYTFRYVIQSAPTRYREAAGAPWKSFDGGRSGQLIVLRPDGATWTVVETRRVR